MKNYFLTLLVVTFSTTQVMKAQNPAWTQKANLSTILRAAPAAFGINSNGYVLTGLDSSNTALNDLWKWNQNTNSWTQKANLPGQTRYSAIAFSIGTKGYVTTGWTQVPSSQLQDLWEYNTSNNTWSAKTSFGGAGRYTASAFVISGSAYVGMGYSPLQNDLWKYNPVTNAWTQKANLPSSPRQGCSGFGIGSYGYIACGFNGSNLTELWRYDPTSNTWLQRANFPGSGRYASGSFVINGKGYVGTGGNGSVFYNDFYCYDPSSNQWTTIANFPGAGRRHSAYFAINGKGYISCGLTSSGYLNDLWEYDPSAFYVSVTSTNVTCNGTNNGTATAIASGTGPFAYLWAPGGQTTSTVTGLSSGLYTVLVTDANGNSSTSSVTITQPPAIIVSVSSVNTICKGESLTLTGLASGGTPPYIYTWNNGAFSGSSYFITPNASASYTLLVTDANACTASQTVQVNVSQLPAAIVSASNSGHACTPDSVKLSTAPGNGFTYQWRKNGILINGASDSVYFTNTSGNYRVEVTKANGCSKLSNAKVVSVATVTTSVSPSGTYTMCAGQTVQLNALPGSGYLYQWKRNGVNVSGANQSTYIVSTAGNYKVKLTDSVTQCYAISANTSVLITCKDGRNAFGAMAYPNPTVNNFTFDFKDIYKENITLELFDISGRLLMQFQEIAPTSKLIIGENLQPGTYYAKVFHGNETMVYRLVKTH